MYFFLSSYSTLDIIYDLTSTFPLTTDGEEKETS